MELEDEKFYEKLKKDEIYNTPSFWVMYCWNKRPLYKLMKKSYKDYCKVCTHYSKNPMWWNHLFTERPNRRETHQLLQRLLNDPTLADELVFPLAKRQTNYYW